MAWTPADAGDQAGSLSPLVPCMQSMWSVARKGLGKPQRYAPFTPLPAQKILLSTNCSSLARFASVSLSGGIPPRDPKEPGVVKTCHRHSATEETSDAPLPPTDDGLLSLCDETALRQEPGTSNNSAYSSRRNRDLLKSQPYLAAGDDGTSQRWLGRTSRELGALRSDRPGGEGCLPLTASGLRRGAGLPLAARQKAVIRSPLDLSNVCPSMPILEVRWTGGGLGGSVHRTSTPQHHGSGLHGCRMA
jgi:hypothetical protein